MTSYHWWEKEVDECYDQFQFEIEIEKTCNQSRCAVLVQDKTAKIGYSKEKNIGWLFSLKIDIMQENDLTNFCYLQ